MKKIECVIKSKMEILCRLEMSSAHDKDFLWPKTLHSMNKNVTALLWNKDLLHISMT